MRMIADLQYCKIYLAFPRHCTVADHWSFSLSLSFVELLIIQRNTKDLSRRRAVARKPLDFSRQYIYRGVFPSSGSRDDRGVTRASNDPFIASHERGRREGSRCRFALGASFKACRIPQRHGTSEESTAGAGWLDSGRTGVPKVPRGTTRCFSLLRVYKQGVGLNTTRGRNITLATRLTAHPAPSPFRPAAPVLALAATPGGPVWRKRCLWRPQAASPVELSATTVFSQPRLRAKGFSTG